MSFISYLGISISNLYSKLSIHFCVVSCNYIDNIEYRWEIYKPEHWIRDLDKKNVGVRKNSLYIKLPPFFTTRWVLKPPINDPIISSILS